MKPTDILEPHAPAPSGVVIPELPARMKTPDMLRAFGISRSRFYELERAGRFRIFEFIPRIGKRMWSGAKVAAFLRGEKVR